MFSTGLTGTYKTRGCYRAVRQVYALWENENAYVDSLGTLQTAP